MDAVNHKKIIIERGKSALNFISKLCDDGREMRISIHIVRTPTLEFVRCDNARNMKEFIRAWMHLILPSPSFSLHSWHIWYEIYRVLLLNLNLQCANNRDAACEAWSVTRMKRVQKINTHSIMWLSVMLMKMKYNRWKFL